MDWDQNPEEEKKEEAPDLGESAAAGTGPEAQTAGGSSSWEADGSPEAGSGAGAGSSSWGAGGSPEAGSEAKAGSEAGSGSEAAGESGSEAGSGSDAEAGSGDGAEAGSGDGSDAEAGSGDGADAEAGSGDGPEDSGGPDIPEAPDPFADAAGAQSAPDYEAEAAEWREKYFRALAEQENAKKRSEKLYEDARKYGAERVFSELIPVLDNLHLALGFINPENPGEKNLAVGVEMTVQDCLSRLSRLGFSELKAKPGEAFDPKIHEAVEDAPAPDLPDGSVALMLKRGYRLHERLLRPVVVRLVKNAAAEPPAAPASAESPPEGGASGSAGQNPEGQEPNGSGSGSPEG
jgi:molecular chaperone GrpE